MPYIQTKGPTTILTVSGASSAAAGSTSSVGSWYQIHPSLKTLAIQSVLAVSSAGATAASTVFIEVTNSTAIGALATKMLTVALTATTDLVSDGGCASSSMAGPWNFIRANLNGLTTSTAGSSLAPTVTVIVNAA